MVTPKIKILNSHITLQDNGIVGCVDLDGTISREIDGKPWRRRQLLFWIGEGPDKKLIGPVEMDMRVVERPNGILFLFGKCLEELFAADLDVEKIAGPLMGALS